jgi:hypothetical protein
MDLNILPLAIIVMAGPQIISAIIFVTAPEASESLHIVRRRRGDRADRGRTYHPHPRRPARQQRLAGRLLRPRIDWQGDPVRARRVAGRVCGEELREPRDDLASEVAGHAPYSQLEDGAQDRTPADLAVPKRCHHPADGGRQPRAQRPRAGRRAAVHRGDDPDRGAPAADLHAVPQSRAWGMSPCARLDEHPHLAREHHRLHRVHRTHSELENTLAHNCAQLYPSTT